MKTDYTTPLKEKETISQMDIEDASKSRKNKILIGVIIGISLFVVAVVIVVVYFVVIYKNKYDFLYINDIHLDPLYVSHSYSNGHFANCRIEIANSTNRPFGQYGCDAPNKTFLSMVDFLPSAVKNPQFILFGGDTPAHSLGYNISQNHELIKYVVNMISTQYSGIPFLYVLGNNEFVPNYGDNHFVGDTDTYESIAEILKPIMNDEQQATFKKGGYYYHDFSKGKLRLLIINSVIYNPDRDIKDDPYDQFQWIKDMSTDGNNKGYKIAVALHIPPGVSYNSGSPFDHGWHEVYMQKFDQIVKDCKIQFILAAHSHYDMFMPIYKNKGVSNAYSLSAPAISAQHSNNPSFRVMTYSDGKLVDYKQFYADIMMNPQNELNWEIEYSFNDAYDQKDLSISSIGKVVDWIKTTGKGRWSYIEKITSLATENGKFYYCILTCTTSEEIAKCIEPLNGDNSISKFFPYNGER